MSHDYNRSRSRTLPTDMPVEVPQDVVHSELYDDVRDYDTLVSQEAYLRGELKNVEAALGKLKSRLAQTVEAGGTRYLQAGNSGVVKITHVMGQGEKIGRINVEQIS